MKTIKGNIVDIHNKEIFSGIIHYSSEGINRIERVQESFSQYILPGLIDAHVHIESSMLVPSSFSRLVVPRGTIGVVADPHEIANVLGIVGVEYMIEEARNTPLKCFFGAPSCVPATPLESSGAIIDSLAIEQLLDKSEVKFLSEMMNFPGVVFADPEVMTKLEAAKKRKMPIDGHAPGLKGEDLKKYAAAGISTDHECFELEEALDKIANGMKIQIRQGSAAKNFEALYKLFDLHPDRLMLCTDDSHPDELISNGHIDKLIKLGLVKGIDIFKLLRAASLIPAQHYNLPVGLLREGDPADFIVVDSLRHFNVLQTFINGEMVFDINEGVLFPESKITNINQFVPYFINEEDLRVMVPGDVKRGKVIKCFDGELITDWFQVDLIPNKEWKSDAQNDILKIAVIDRYHNKPVSVAFIQGFGLNQGAIASSVAHDSHNVVVVGVDDSSMVAAVNLIMENKGGLSIADHNSQNILPLPIAGLMSNLDGKTVGTLYARLEKEALKLGAKLKAPFMSLSFMALLVIPKLKIGDQGLFDGEKFEFTSLFE